MPLPITITSNRRFLIIGERPSYRTLSMENHGDGSVLVEFDIESTEYLDEQTSKRLVAPYSIERISAIDSLGTGLFENMGRIKLHKAYWRILLEHSRSETLLSDYVRIVDIPKFFAKPTWGKKDYWTANQLQYILSLYCAMGLEIFPGVYKRFRKTRHKYLIASQRRRK